jgi:hypothetical protein
MGGSKMKIQTFRNGKGLIHGPDPKRIGCDKKGVLKIGNTEISISPEADSVMPLLFHGANADYNATFTTDEGRVYILEKVAVRGGHISTPPQTTLEIMELRCRADEAEAECEALREKIRELENLFDTNSLNFLIG